MVTHPHNPLTLWNVQLYILGEPWSTPLQNLNFFQLSIVNMAICWRNTNQASGLALVYDLFHWLLTFFTSGLGGLGGFCFGAGCLRSVSSESRLPRGLWSSLFWRRTEEGRPTVASKVGTPRRSLWWLELGSSLGGSGRRLSMSSSSLGSGRLTNRCSILIC